MKTQYSGILQFKASCKPYRPRLKGAMGVLLVQGTKAGGFSLGSRILHPKFRKIDKKKKKKKIKLQADLLLDTP